MTLLVDAIPSNNTQTTYKSKSKARHPSTRSNEQKMSVPDCYFEKDANQKHTSFVIPNMKRPTGTGVMLTTEQNPQRSWT